jgi:predicted transcriptional regulator
MADMVGKWGEPVAGRGFAQIPNYLLLLNQFLDEERRLSPAELLIIIQLVGAWWEREEMPFPALKTLATRSGISDRQAQRAVSRLEEMNLIKRVKRKKSGMIASNAYDMSPLVNFLGEVAKAFPNEFERKINKSEMKKIGSLLQKLDPAVTDEEVENENTSIEQGGNFVVRPRPKRKINLEN